LRKWLALATIYHDTSTFQVTAMIVEIPTNAAELADMMSAMRDWLDRNHCTPVHFETKSHIVLIRVEFNEAADAEAFRLAFKANQLADAAV
jgi:hypothetical protein